MKRRALATGILLVGLATAAWIFFRRPPIFPGQLRSAVLYDGDAPEGAPLPPDQIEGLAAFLRARPHRWDMACDILVVTGPKGAPRLELKTTAGCYLFQRAVHPPGMAEEDHFLLRDGSRWQCNWGELRAFFGLAPPAARQAAEPNQSPDDPPRRSNER